MQNPITLLVVDDDPLLLRTLALALGARGYRVLTAGCVREGVERALAGEPIDAIVVDWLLPDGLGWELVDHLRSIGGTPPPTVLISASMLAWQEVRSHGVVAYLPKPFSIDRLVEVVSQALRGPGGPYPAQGKEVIL